MGVAEIVGGESLEKTLKTGWMYCLTLLGTVRKLGLSGGEARCRCEARGVSARGHAQNRCSDQVPPQSSVILPLLSAPSKSSRCPPIYLPCTTTYRKSEFFLEPKELPSNFAQRRSCEQFLRLSTRPPSLHTCLEVCGLHSRRLRMSFGA